MNKLFAEGLGTFCLVFAGTGAIVVNEATGGAVSHVGVALTFGLVVMVMVYALGDISGAHINPAVTTAFWISGRFPARDVPKYIGAQCVGALLASLLMMLVFPNSETLGTTAPHGSPGQSFMLEAVMSFMLMLVILIVSTGPKEKGLLAGIAIGGTIGVDALFGGPISGASMNPARSLGPAVVSGHLANLWIYIAAPILGAALAIPALNILRKQPAQGA